MELSGEIGLVLGVFFYMLSGIFLIAGVGYSTLAVLYKIMKGGF